MNQPGSAPLEQALEALIDTLAERVASRLQQAAHAAVPDSRSPWMSIHAAADHLDWPRQRLYKLTAAGAIPHYKQDGRLLFRRDELDHWLSQYAEGERDWISAPQASYMSAMPSGPAP